MSTIQLYDATLRDGMGGGGMTLTAAEKVRVVRALDELGVDMIEAGFPASNPKELELFELLEHERLQNAEIVAFGMTRRRGKDAAQDEGLRVLAESFVPVVTLVGKSSAAQAETVLKVTRAENLAMIGESIAHLVAHGKRVLFDAEHFFDGYREDAKLRAGMPARGGGGGSRAGGAVRHERGVAAVGCQRGRQNRARADAGHGAGHTHPRRHRMRRGEHAQSRCRLGRRRCRGRSTGSASGPGTRTS